MQKAKIEMPRTRQNLIKEYLNKNNCSPSVSGYNVLLSVISLALDNPDDNCEELFEKYISLVYEKPSVKANRCAYRAATYCVHNSYSSAPGVYNFIRSCCNEIEGMG